MITLFLWPAYLRTKEVCKPHFLVGNKIPVDELVKSKKLRIKSDVVVHDCALEAKA